MTYCVTMIRSITDPVERARRLALIYAIFSRNDNQATTAGTCPDDAAVVAEGRSANKPISSERIIQDER